MMAFLEKLAFHTSDDDDDKEYSLSVQSLLLVYPCHFFLR